MKKPETDLEMLSAETALEAHSFKDRYANFSNAVERGVNKAHSMGKQGGIAMVLKKLESYKVKEREDTKVYNAIIQGFIASIESLLIK